MDNVLLLFLTAVFLSLFFGTSLFRPSRTMVKSNYDGKTYLVRDLPDKQNAADELAYIRALLTAMVSRLRVAYPQNQKITQMARRFKHTEFQESDSSIKNSTSYSVNKGETLVFCIREKTPSNQLVPMNTVVFVAIHELAHIFSVTHGHTEEFWENFRFLLAHAIEWKLYESVNYRKKRTKYCGTVITDTPLLEADAKKYIEYSALQKSDVLNVQLPSMVQAS